MRSTGEWRLPRSLCPDVRKFGFAWRAVVVVFWSYKEVPSQSTKNMSKLSEALSERCLTKTWGLNECLGEDTAKLDCSIGTHPIPGTNDDPMFVNVVGADLWQADHTRSSHIAYAGYVAMPVRLAIGYGDCRSCKRGMAWSPVHHPTSVEEQVVSPIATKAAPARVKLPLALSVRSIAVAKAPAEGMGVPLPKSVAVAWGERCRIAPDFSGVQGKPRRTGRRHSSRQESEGRAAVGVNAAALGCWKREEGRGRTPIRRCLRHVGPRKVGNWNMLAIVLIQRQHYKNLMDLAYTFCSMCAAGMVEERFDFRGDCVRIFLQNSVVFGEAIQALLKYTGHVACNRKA